VADHVAGEEHNSPDDLMRDWLEGLDARVSDVDAAAVHRRCCCSRRPVPPFAGQPDIRM
jgi:hypothetical protein